MQRLFGFCNDPVIVLVSYFFPVTNITLIDATIYILLYEETEGSTIPILLYDERIRANLPQFLVPGYGKQNCFCDRSICVKRFRERPLKYVFSKQ